MRCIFIAILMLIAFVTNPVLSAADNSLDENGIQPQPKIIVIDPGHGGYDPGAVHGSILEKDINLAISEKLKKCLEDAGIKVVLTRSGDYNYAIKGLHGLEAKRYDLHKRVEMAQEEKADILLTLHVNSVRKSTYRGAETFYHPTSQEGKRLALAIKEEFSSIPDMKKRDTKMSLCYMLRCSKMPAVLVEVGYLSNPVERKLLLDDSYRNLLAEKITAGVVNYFQEQ